MLLLKIYFQNSQEFTQKDRNKLINIKIKQLISVKLSIIRRIIIIFNLLLNILMMKVLQIYNMKMKLILWIGN